MVEVKNDNTEVEIAENDPSHFSATLNNDGTVETQDLTPETGNDDTVRFNAIAAVDAALNGQALDFEKEIKTGLADRIQNAVERKRDEVAQSVFGTPNQEVASDDSDDSEEIETEEDNEPEE